MRLPRWTVYPALGVLTLFAAPGTPLLVADPNAGAALAARASAEPDPGAGGVSTGAVLRPGEAFAARRAARAAAGSAVVGPLSGPAAVVDGPVRRVAERELESAPAAPQPGARERARDAHERVIVLGIDGLDPVLLQSIIERHPERMPNFRWLIEQGGGIHPLGTSTPPQSPVAWSDFITGRDPGGHGIFDFIHRDLETRGPVGSALRTRSRFFGLLESDEPNRSGRPFWQVLADNGIPADIWRMPANFPVDRSLGVSFSGMLTPAVDSAYGECSLYTSDPFAPTRITYDKLYLVDVRRDVIRTHVHGPDLGKGERARTPLTIYLDREAGAAVVRTPTHSLVLTPGRWSDFVPFQFDLGLLDSANGIGRFYLRSIEPEFELYLSPINIDPTSPWPAPVSEPASAAKEVAQAVGLYYTQGMPEDVQALKYGVLSDGEFADQSQLVYLEGRRLLAHALERHLDNARGGLLFFYFSTVDLMSHMLWRHADTEHPHHDPEFAATSSETWSGREGSRWMEILDDIYLRMDPVLGQVREAMGDEPYTLIVMSDHGFAPFRRKFSLNTWLLEEGYLVLNEGRERETSLNPTRSEEVLFWMPGVVDWSRTRAYGMGFNGLYLNLAGREGGRRGPAGIVQPGEEADALLAEIAAKLEALIDPETGEPVVLRADPARRAYRNHERLAESPDMIVGYASGYCNSDESSLGRITHQVLTDNLGGTFNGSHLMAPEVVPGTLLANRPVRGGPRGLTDLTAEILIRYGLDLPPDVQGGRVLADEHPTAPVR